MNFPLISEYIEAIKSAEDNFDELSCLRPVLDDDGLPVMTSGNFAVVFKMKDLQSGKLYAVKCFTKEQEGRSESYKLIADELEFVSSNYLTPISYLENELFVDTEQTSETEFPVLLMDWVEGIPLDSFIKKNINDQYMLEMLTFRFGKLAEWLISQPFAHGDLKPDNILVKENGAIVLVDYDGMYVPAMKGQYARELGSQHFRHPARTEAVFNERIDDFSLALITLSLKTFSLNKELIHDYCTNDYFLFREKDYACIKTCKVISFLLDLFIDAEFQSLFGVFLVTLANNSLTNVSPKLLVIENPKSGRAYSEYLYNQARSFCEAEDNNNINYDKAFLLFKKSAKIGNVDAQCCLGCCFKNGYGTQVDYIKARELFDISAKNGCARALRHIAMCFEDGLGGNKNMDEAMKWYIKAIEQGDYKSSVIMGKIFYYGRSGVSINYAEAVKWFTMAAEHDDSDGMWRLGNCYKYGHGVFQDHKKAFELFQNAAKKNNSDGQWKLGDCYLYGEGTDKNYKTAVKWYNKAFENLNLNGFWKLGHCFEYGFGVEKNIDKAFILYKAAAENGSSEGQWRLGQCYRYARGVPRNITDAIKWYKKAAKQGHKKAKDTYERLSEDSFEIYKDGCIFIDNKEYKKAYEVFRSIALDPYGKNGIGICYINGYFVEKNYEKAAYWFQKAARQGLSIAQFNFGNCNYNGIGMTYHKGAASYWYQMAAEQGLDIANEMLTYVGTGHPLLKKEEDKMNVERWKKISNLFILDPSKIK